MRNRWVNAAIPALLIHCSIGTVYCWSTFKEAIAESIQMSTFSVGWAFSLAIFFLGISAAFAGRMVETNIHRSSFISALCFSGGMIGTGLSIQYLSGVPALIGIYLSYGVLMGIGLGIGYITPVKTIMLWFSDHKGLATGISIMGFGLAKAIATPIMERLQESVGIVGMFFVLGLVYLFAMLVGHILLKKPVDWIEEAASKNRLNIKKSTFICIWLMFFINIHCGLMLITYEKQLIGTVFPGITTLLLIIPSVTALFNAFGRIGYSTLSDKLSDRNTVYRIIFITCCGIALATLVSGMVGILVVVLLLIVNAGYGGGFSTLPALLSERFGMANVSQIHGLTLTAWAIAGLTGNNMSEAILNCGGSYTTILSVVMVLYLIGFAIAVIEFRRAKNAY